MRRCSSRPATRFGRSWRYACAENADHPRAKELFDRHKLPAFHDPFAGGGALPLEAQRLGLEAYASDLNPVAVLINKAMIEIPPKFAGQPPVNPESRRKLSASGSWQGAQGLAEDVRYYGQWMRDEAEKRIGHLYPKIEITAEVAEGRRDLQPLVGRKLTVIAWLWARTVKSPNPAFAQVDVPLASTFMLSTKSGKEAYVEPVIENGSYRFTVKVGEPKDAEAAKNGTKLARGANFKCLMSGTPMAGDYIKAEGRAGRMGARLMAIVAEGERGRVYLAPMPEHEAVVREAKPGWKPENDLVGKCRDQLPLYGMNTFADLFTPRQLVALTTFSDLAQEARERVKQDAVAAFRPPHPPAPSPSRGEGEQERRIVIGWELERRMQDCARQFRKMPTPSENLLWQALRNRQLLGLKFRRQQPIGPFVVDFFCAEQRVIVEVDGPIHESQHERDAERQSLLEQCGYQVSFELKPRMLKNVYLKS